MNDVSPFAIPLREQLVKVLKAFHKATGRPISAVSSKVLNSSARFQMIIDGGDIGTKKFEHCMRYFSDNWPEDTPWPESVPRPEPNRSEAA